MWREPQPSTRTRSTPSCSPAQAGAQEPVRAVKVEQGTAYAAWTRPKAGFVKGGGVSASFAW